MSLYVKSLTSTDLLFTEEESPLPLTSLASDFSASLAYFTDGSELCSSLHPEVPRTEHMTSVF